MHRAFIVALRFCVSLSISTSTDTRADAHLDADDISLLQHGLQIQAQATNGTTLAVERGRNGRLVDTVLTPPSFSTVPPMPGTGWKANLSDCALINPSFVIKSSEVWMFLRRSCDIFIPPGIETYMSELVFVSLSLDAFREGGVLSNLSAHNCAIAPDHRFQDADPSDVECLFHVRNPIIYQGQEVFTQRAFGPEDPRVFLFDGKVYMYHVSTDIASKSQTEVDEFSGRPMCLPGYGMYPHLAEILEIYPQIKYGPSVPLRYDEMLLEEKGWSMFEWRSPEGGMSLLSVYSVIPHTVLRIDPVTGNSTVFSNDSSQVVLGFAQAWNSTQVSQIHGGSGVALVEDEEEPYYLAALHFNCDKWLPDKQYEYVTYPYKFRAEPPFDIISIGSRRLPLKQNAVRIGQDGVGYVSSMAYDMGDVVIGYGQADEFAHIYRQPLSEFLETFFSGRDYEDLSCER